MNTSSVIDVRPPIGHVDNVAGGRVIGWAIGHDVIVEALIGGESVSRVVPTRVRNDVAVAYADREGALTSGFSLELPPGALDSDSVVELTIVARPSSPDLPSVTLATLQIAGTSLQDALKEVPSSNLFGPFPRPITDLIASRWPEDCSDLSSEAGQRRFASRVKQLLDMPGLNAIPAVADYARFLAATIAHCRFVEKHFPTSNVKAQGGGSDVNCKPNSVRELFPIIHQLYVLRSLGVEGDFAEFGCFKGYSSSMLSFACERLGLTMHIFDSFEGLPPAEGSGYKPGQYAGSLDEVKENVTRFGAPQSIKFHKGFFAETFRKWRPPALMCMWMDVDLEVSSRDLMVVADRLDARGNVFSHECTADIFQDGRIVTAPHPANPIEPLKRRFEELGRSLTGHYVSGFTGAFWPRRGGVPVVRTDVLFDLVSNYDPCS
jgi:hypothetical protein